MVETYMISPAQLSGRHVDVTVIGAGQAGLAAAHELVVRGFVPGESLVVLDSNDGPGGAWRHRWDPLTFDKAHGIADLPGLALGRPDPAVPSRLVVADYYGRYEEQFGLGVVRPVRADAVRDAGLPDRPRALRVEASGPEGPVDFTTSVVVSATGTWTHPFVPHVPGIETFTGRQLRTVDYTRPEDFADQRVLVVGGGLSAVQFLLPIARFAASTTWATRRPPNFTASPFVASEWGVAVERAVRERTTVGRAPASVVRTTGIPLWREYLEGVDAGVLVSRGMVRSFGPRAARFVPEASFAGGAEGLGPSASDRLVVPASWQPFDAVTDVEVDTVLWATGFRAALKHLAPLRLREPGGGVLMRDEVRVARDDRILLVGYGSSASTTGATRAGRRAGRAAAAQLGVRRAAA
jgi:cation diffusion facilitator CzcD-associated flavoprotein CzcO